MTGKSPRAASFLGKASDIVEIVGFKGVKQDVIVEICILERCCAIVLESSVCEFGNLECTSPSGLASRTYAANVACHFCICPLQRQVCKLTNRLDQLFEL